MMGENRRYSPLLGLLSGPVEHGGGKECTLPCLCNVFVVGYCERSTYSKVHVIWVIYQPLDNEVLCSHCPADQTRPIWSHIVIYSVVIATQPTLLTPCSVFYMVLTAYFGFLRPARNHRLPLSDVRNQSTRRALSSLSEPPPTLF